MQLGIPGRKKYIGIDCSAINHFPHHTNKILIVAEFKKTTPKNKQKYEEIVSVWLDWLRHQDKIEANDIRIEYENNSAKLRVIFKDNFEDYLAVFPIIANNQLGFKVVNNIAFCNFDN